MNREEILEKSRKENRNKDLAELDIEVKAGSVAARVGATVCVLISTVFVFAADTMPSMPWIIYFSIIGTNSLVKFVKLKRKTDLTLTILFFVILVLWLAVFAARLLGVRL